MRREETVIKRLVTKTRDRWPREDRLNWITSTRDADSTWFSKATDRKLLVTAATVLLAARWKTSAWHAWKYSRVGRPDVVVTRSKNAFPLCHLRYCRLRRKILGLWDHLRAARLVNIQRHLWNVKQPGIMHTKPSAEVSWETWLCCSIGRYWEMKIIATWNMARSSRELRLNSNYFDESIQYWLRKVRDSNLGNCEIDCECAKYNCITTSSYFNFFNLKFQS